jgi:hypothetical protein
MLSAQFFIKHFSSKKFLIVIFLLSVFIFPGCLKFEDDISNAKPTKYFTQQVNGENSQKEYSKGDTLWFNAIIPDSLTDYNSGELILLKNASFIFSGEIYLLKPLYDSLHFLDNNFDIIVTDGSIELVNIIENNYTSYMFTAKFGKPLVNNKIRFGIIPHYLGIFSFEVNANVYYGEDRIDYNDFSQDNEMGVFSMTFNIADVNSEVYYALPPTYRQAYDSYYTTSYINAKRFYFIEVSE